MNIESFGKMTPSVAMSLGIFVFCFLCPGFLLWYLNSPALVENLDFLKLCVMSVAVSSPPFVARYFITVVCFSAMKAKNLENLHLYGDHVDWYVRHGVGNAMTMYMLVFISYVLSLGWSEVIWVMLGAVSLTVASEIFMMVSFIRNPKTSLVTKIYRPSEHTPREG